VTSGVPAPPEPRESLRVPPETGGGLTKRPGLPGGGPGGSGGSGGSAEILPHYN
jgi:hypothetical protein